MYAATSTYEEGRGRKRVSLACEQCRTRRSRCDGKQPRCGTCEKKDTRCEYRYEGNKRKPPSKRYVESLQAHIALLEERLTALGQKVTKMDTPHAKDTLPVEKQSASNAEEVGNKQSVKSDSPDGSSLRDPVDEMVQRVGRLNIGEDGQLRYFGAQSNYNLLHGPLYDKSNKYLQQFQTIGLATAEFLGKSVEVSQDLQDHLLELYWRWQNPFLYIIHKRSFMQDYVKGSAGKHCSPLLLSAIFALASRFSDRIEVRSDPADPHSAGNKFAEQAKILLLYECEAPATTTVQAASLLSLRWMSENKESLGWLYMGMATRMAYNLGIHLDCSEWVKAGMISEQDAQVRNITWWGCYKLDKLYCLGLGRPGTTKPRDITCQKPDLEPDVEFGPWKPMGDKDKALLGAHSRIHSAMQYSCDHLNLISEPLEIIYSPGGITQAEAEKIVAKADVRFNAFYTALPSHLRLPPSPRMPCLPHIYQLHVQFHVMQIQLHRSLIGQGHKLGKSSKGSAKSDHHLGACRRSATAIARILRMYQYHYTLRLTPIVTVVNTFSAAVIHLMDAASPDQEIRRSAHRNLEICMASLDTMALAWMWSRRALRAVRLLAHEWLIPHVSMPAKATKTIFQSPFDSKQVDPVPDNWSEVSSMPALPAFESTSGVREWAMACKSVGSTSQSQQDYDTQSILTSLFGENNLFMGFDSNNRLADIEAAGQLGGDYYTSGQSDPWFLNAINQNPMVFDQWDEYPNSADSQGAEWAFDLDCLGRDDTWTAQQGLNWW